VRKSDIFLGCRGPEVGNEEIHKRYFPRRILHSPEFLFFVSVLLPMLNQSAPRRDELGSRGVAPLFLTSALD
jgi:hypothetical protein